MLPSVRDVILFGTHPQLNLDFTLGVLDPRITFTRASTATFVGSNGLIQTAASGAARFGFDPSSLQPLGLLVEEARTNLILRSGDLSNAAWSTLADAGCSVSVTANSATAPDGTATASKVTIARTATTKYAQVYQVFTGTAAVYAGTLYLKADAAGDVGRQITVLQYNGTVVGGIVTVTLTAAWQRVPSIMTLAASANCRFIVGYSADGGSTEIASVSFDAWGGQVELTSANYPGPTSYIPTTTATVTRAADVASMTGANFSSWYNQGAGTFVTQATPPGDYNQLGFAIALHNGGATSYIIIGKANASIAAAGKRWAEQTYVGTVNQSTIGTSADGAATTAKLGFAYKTSDFALVVAGVLAGTTASGAPPTTNDRMYIGSYNGAQSWLNGHIGSIKYYNKRLPNGKLQSLTS